MNKDRLMVQLRRIKEDISRDMCSTEQCKKCLFCVAYNISMILEAIRKEGEGKDGE